MRCKLTGKKINPFMSFGKMPIANGFLDKKNFSKEFFYEMRVGFSEDFSLFQLDDHPSPKSMFHNNYPFYTSSSNFMIKHFKKYANWSKKFLGPHSKLIELGSNDGTFLKNFTKTNIESVGFEPSKNVHLKAKNQGVLSINKFFNQKSISLVKSFYGNTSLICGANVICHIPDLNELFSCIIKLLNTNGIFVFEEPYLGSVFQKTSYDQIYDEHIYLFSCVSISKIAEFYDLRLIDAIPQITHGGSMRYVLARKDSKWKVSKNVNKIMSEEYSFNLDNNQFCKIFRDNCEKSKKNLRKKLIDLKNNNKKICGYAATSKSTTILNYCNIGKDLIDFITDTTPEKIGKFTPGTHIPVIDHKNFLYNKPDIAVLFAWNHKKEIFLKEKNFKKSGGKWLTFFPNIKLW